MLCVNKVMEPHVKWIKFTALFFLREETHIGQIWPEHNRRVKELNNTRGLGQKAVGVSKPKQAKKKKNLQNTPLRQQRARHDSYQEQQTVDRYTLKLKFGA